MIFLLLFTVFHSAQAFPNFLTQQEIEHENNGSVTWDCFLTSEIKKIECREWIDDTGLVASEKSDMDMVVENNNAIYSYGFNNAHHVCREIKKDMLAILKGQKYFCMLGDDLELKNFEPRKKELKPILGRVYKCLKTPVGQVGWFGGFGHCL